MNDISEKNMDWKERSEKLIEILRKIKSETCCAGDLHSSHVEINSKDKAFMELQDFIQLEVTLEREKIRNIIKNLDDLSIIAPNIRGRILDAIDSLK